MLSFFPRGVLDEILNLIESISEGFPSYSLRCFLLHCFLTNVKGKFKILRTISRFVFFYRQNKKNSIKVTLLTNHLLLD